MKRYFIFAFATILFACNSNPKSENSTAQEPTNNADTTKASTEMKQQISDTTYEFSEATAISKSIDTVSKNKVSPQDTRPAYILNQRDNTTLLYWWYDGSGYQNMNCPVGRTCPGDDVEACKRNGQYVQIGNVPCDVTIQVHAIFREPDGRQVQRNVTNSRASCSVGKHIFILRK